MIYKNEPAPLSIRLIFGVNLTIHNTTRKTTLLPICAWYVLLLPECWHNGLSVRLTAGRSQVQAPGGSNQRLRKWYPLPSQLALDIYKSYKNGVGKLNTRSYQWTSPLLQLSLHQQTLVQGYRNGDNRSPLHNWRKKGL